MKGRKIGDIFLPAIFLPTENRGGIHYGEGSSVPSGITWIVVRLFLIGVNTAEPIAAPMAQTALTVAGPPPTSESSNPMGRRKTAWYHQPDPWNKNWKRRHQAPLG